MKLKLTTACLLALATNANALELEVGVGYSDKPLYVYASKVNAEEQYKNKVVGKIGLSHTFDITKVVGIKVWADHYSLLTTREMEAEPNGKNFIGVSGIIKLF